MADFAHALEQQLELPCGAVLRNRLAKCAMSDSLADGEGNPTTAQIRLYQRWAEGGIGLSIVGEVQGDPRFPEKPGNLVLDEHSNNDLLRTLTRRATGNGAHLWPQLGHAGALAHTPISQPMGPSAIAIERLQCGGMSLLDIQALPSIYANAALHAKTVGFTGLQIHAGHGFLLSQFLSPLFNRRRDDYGGDIQGRGRIVLEIIDEVRNAVGRSFPVGIRVNSSDKLEGGLTETDALEFLRMLDKTSLDLIDISGGTYFPGARSASDDTAGGPYFLRFAECARAITSLPLMVSGGFKIRQQAIDAVASDVADLVGLGRGMVLDPKLADHWLDGKAGDPGYDPAFPRFASSPPPGGITAWYTLRMAALGEDRERAFDLDPGVALKIYEERDAARCVKWRKRFAEQ